MVVRLLLLFLWITMQFVAGRKCHGDKLETCYCLRNSEMLCDYMDLISTRPSADSIATKVLFIRKKLFDLSETGANYTHAWMNLRMLITSSGKFKCDSGKCVPLIPSTIRSSSALLPNINPSQPTMKNTPKSDCRDGECTKENIFTTTQSVHLYIATKDSNLIREKTTSKVSLSLSNRITRRDSTLFSGTPPSLGTILPENISESFEMILSFNNTQNIPTISSDSVKTNKGKLQESWCFWTSIGFGIIICILLLILLKCYLRMKSRAEFHVPPNEIELEDL